MTKATFSEAEQSDNLYDKNLHKITWVSNVIKFTE